MFRKIFLISLALICCYLAGLQAQSITPNVSPSSGGYYTNGGISISWTMGETFTTTLQNGSTLITQGEQQPEIDLLTGTLASVIICVGSSIAIPYTAKGYYGPANVFTVQLSDAAGSFAAAVNIGSLNAQTSGNIIAVIPPGTAAGAGYRVRVISNLPAYTGKDNGSNITVIAVPVAGISDISVSPNGCDLVTLMASGGSSFQWSGGNTPGQAQNSFTASGTYTVTVTNINGCTDTASKVITVTPSTGNVTTFTACNSYTWSVNGQTYITSGTYTWVSGCHTETLNLTVNFGASTTNTTYQIACNSYTWPFNGQTYSASGIYTHVVGCQTEILNLTINEGNTSIGSVSGITSSICEGETISTTAYGGSDYQWSGPNGFTFSGAVLFRPNATTDMSGLYTVIISAGNGCASTMISTLINVNTIPVADISGINNICAGNTLSLTATGGTSYQWSGPGGYSSSNASINRTNATVLMSGTYNVTASNTNGCTGMASMTVLVNAATPVTIIGATTVCMGNTINLTATGGINYQWSGPGGFTATGAAMTRTATAGTGGTYSVTLTDANGCTAMKAVTVTVASSSVSASITGLLTYCAGTTMMLTASGGATYQWSGPGGFSASGNILSIPSSTPAMTGTYVVIVTNAGGCTASNSRNITVHPLPNAVITGNTNICAGSTLILSASGGTSYAWSGPGFTSTAANIARTNVTVAMGGTYTVTVTGTGGCKSTESVLVTVNAKPIVTITGATSVCSGTTITFTATGGTGYAWSGPGAYTANTATIELPGATTLMGGSYKVTVTNAAGCTTTASKSVTVIASPNAVISGVSSVCTGLNFSQTASGGVSYLWNFPDGPTASSATFTRVGATLAMGGFYDLTVTGSNGCKSVASKLIIVNTCLSKTVEEVAEPGLTAYPNPTDAATTLAFTSLSAEQITLSVYATDGREVAVLFKGPVEAGATHQFDLDTQYLPSGTYYAELRYSTGTAERLPIMIVR